MKAKVVTFQILVIGAFLSALLVAGESIQGSREEEIQIVQKAIQEATRNYDERMALATMSGAQSSRSEPKKSTKYSREIGRISNIYRNAYKILISSKMVQETALNHLREALPEQCQPPQVACDPNALFRTVDGFCNNLNRTHWGAAGMANTRILLPVYEGEDDEPRGGISGSVLPPPREVSLAVHSGDGSKFVTDVTHMVAQFGQFLDHDISLTSVEGPNCCDNPDQPDCWRIDVRPDDPFYKGRRTCLNFVRSTEYCFPRPENASREQMNGITAYIDGSVMYGSSQDLVSTLRLKEGGKLVVNSDHPGFLPWRSDVNMTDNEGRVIAGDARADENPGLAVLQSLFLREHNRIAIELAKLRPDWDDERIFQETRRIIAAELQQISYGEFLPAVLGQEYMSEHGWGLPGSHEEYTVYDETVDATIFNSFATAAYRFGHTLVNGLVELYLGDTAVGSYNVRHNYLNVTQMISVSNGTSGFNLILNGLIRQRSQAYDAEISEDMTNFLFNDISTMIGQDLAARNIQRGRDHGLPGYNEFRKYCKLTSLGSNSDAWNDAQRPQEISEESWANLQSVYDSPEHIDLYTGGLSEIPAEGTLSGPTFICLQALQFERLMKGDRFFFTHRDQVGSFSKEQLATLRKRTFGDIICQNSDLGKPPEMFSTFSQTRILGFPVKMIVGKWIFPYLPKKGVTLQRQLIIPLSRF